MNERGIGGQRGWRGFVAGMVLATLALAGCSGPERAADEPPPPSVVTATAALPAPTEALPGSPTAAGTLATPTMQTLPTATTIPTPVSISRACAPGIDLLGFSDALDKTVVDGVRVGNISAIAWAGGDDYLGLSDRDGFVYRIAFPLGGTPKAQSAFQLTDAAGEPYPTDSIDGEGLALDGGDLLVASEVGPAVNRYDSAGRLLAAFPVPQRFLVAPDGQGTLNQTFESLALSADGQTLWTGNERPLAGDGEDADGRGRVRLLRYRREGDTFVPDAEYAYLTEPGQGLSELIALGDGSLLALERGLSLKTGFTAQVYRVTLGGATDVAQIDALDGAGATPATKTLFVDLSQCPVTPGGGPAGAFSPLLDNFEGMTFGPDLADGRHSLLLVSDDNDQSLQVTRLIVLAIDPRVLP